MDKNEVQRILTLQNSAYQLLLWLDKRAENEPKILSDSNLEKWRYAESCEAWVRESQGMFPQVLRPSVEDIPAFARLFSSFFQTSFRIIENAPTRSYDDFGNQAGYEGSGQRRLAAGAPEGKKSSKGKAKVKDSAHELRLIALEELALENAVFPSRVQLEALVNDEDLRESLTLWTWFHELNRRAQFNSQGAAVRSLWQDMEKAQREKMSADKILEARAEMLAALKALPSA